MIMITHWAKPNLASVWSNVLMLVIPKVRLIKFYILLGTKQAILEMPFTANPLNSVKEPKVRYGQDK